MTWPARPQVDAVLEDRQPVDAGQVDAGHLRAQRLRPCPHDQHVERLVEGVPAGQVAHRHPAGAQIDGLDLVADLHRDGPLGELLRCPDHQVPPVVDHAAGQVGQAAGGVGHVRAALEGEDLQLVRRTPAPGLGGRAHPGGVAPYHHHPRAHPLARHRIPQGVGHRSRRPSLPHAGVGEGPAWALLGSPGRSPAGRRARLARRRGDSPLRGLRRAGAGSRAFRHLPQDAGRLRLAAALVVRSGLPG